MIFITLGIYFLVVYMNCWYYVTKPEPPTMAPYYIDIDKLGPRITANGLEPSNFFIKSVEVHNSDIAPEIELIIIPQGNILRVKL